MSQSDSPEDSHLAPAVEPDPRGSGSQSPFPVPRQILVAAIVLLLSGWIVFSLGRELTYAHTRVYEPIGTILEEEATGALWSFLLVGVVYYESASVAKVIVPLCFVLAVVLWKRPRTRLIVFLIGVTFSMAWISKELERPRYRRIFRSAFEKVPARAEPLIAALEAYKMANDYYPEELDSLVPDFIEAIPDTGLAGYPRFEYQRNGTLAVRGKYELLIRTSIGGLNWDVFYYRGVEADSGYNKGDALEPFGKWVYFHE